MVITYSPTGRLFQIEYALEAIKQGSAAVGLVSKEHVVLVTLKRNAEDLGSYQKKLIRIDDHMGVALAGLAPDARILSNGLRNEAINAKFVYDRPLSMAKASSYLGRKAQNNTQFYGRRPYGVGLLVAAYDETGPHLCEFLPSGSVLEYQASAIGARSQAARTYLERNVEKLAESTLEALIIHGLNALRDTLAQDKELTLKNTSVAIVGKDTPFKIIEEEDIIPWLDRLHSVSRSQSSQETSQDPGQETSQSAGQETAEDGQTESMDTSQ